MRTPLVALVVAVLSVAGQSGLRAGQPAAPDLVDRQVESGTTTLHIRCGGVRQGGTPLVVLEAGAFNTLETWRDVQPPISTFARVCAHDRPGRGTSGPPPDGLDGPGYVALLATALGAAGEPPPYVLVGHSLGGLIAQLYVALRPDEVAGVVLVDSSHPDQVGRLSTLPARPAVPASAPAPRPEAVSLDALSDALHHAPPSIGVPLAVLTRSRWTGADGPVDRAWLEAWKSLQRDLAAQSRRSRHIQATDSGHYLQNDQPVLVIEAVRWTLDSR